MSHDHGIHGHAHHATSAKDPVCGMDVSLDAGKPTGEHAGTVYHFCSQKCHDKFVANPQRYLSPTPAEVEAAPAGAEYICPMHPGGAPDRAGNLPKVRHGTGTSPARTG